MVAKKNIKENLDIDIQEISHKEQQEENLMTPLNEDASQEEEENIEKIEATKTPKPKKILNENQMKAVSIDLAKGRENLKLKQEQQRLDREKRKEELLNVKQEIILQKAQKIKKVQEKKIDKTKAKIDKIVDTGDVEYDEEEMIITKKPKKKRIIYKEESDSEEEVVVKKAPKSKPVSKIPLLQFF